MTKLKPMDLSHFSIWIVDDDAMVRTIIKDYLFSFGFKQVYEAKDGREACKWLQDSYKRVDLIISDWEMPRMDGLVLLKSVRMHPLRQHVKFIMVTSQSSRERAKITQAKLSQVDAYLVKPFRGETFKEKIFAVLGIELPDEKKTKAG